MIPSVSVSWRSAALLLGVMSGALRAAESPVPVVFRVSEGVRPQALLSLYGEFLSGTPRVQFIRQDGSVAATQSSVQIDPAGHFCRVVFPAIAPGAYRISVGSDAGWSTQAIYVNRAEPRWISEEAPTPGCA